MKLTPREEVLRIAISGNLWTFMTHEEDLYIRSKLLTRKDWTFIEGLDTYKETMQRIINFCEEEDLPYSVNDDHTTLYIEGEEKIDGPIHTMLIEIPDKEEDDES